MGWWVWTLKAFLHGGLPSETRRTPPGMGAFWDCLRGQAQAVREVRGVGACLGVRGRRGVRLRVVGGAVLAGGPCAGRASRREDVVAESACLALAAGAADVVLADLRRRGGRRLDDAALVDELAVFAFGARVLEEEEARRSGRRSLCLLRLRRHRREALECSGGRPTRRRRKRWRPAFASGVVTGLPDPDIAVAPASPSPAGSRRPSGPSAASVPAPQIHGSEAECPDPEHKEQASGHGHLPLQRSSDRRVPCAAVQRGRRSTSVIGRRRRRRSFRSRCDCRARQRTPAGAPSMRRHRSAAVTTRARRAAGRLRRRPSSRRRAFSCRGRIRRGRACR
mmetsp:Transcript_28722/g.99103  ORF Transcript_28722/g.99103 Transcript_28722/m.99103 type:complete len:337 (-) Transcript_28722:1689-2699(-)